MDKSTRKVLTEKKYLICDYCESNVAIGVYASNFGPFSLAACGDCLEYNIATLRHILVKWVKYGTMALCPLIPKTSMHMNDSKFMVVFYKGFYRSATEVVNEVTIEEVKELFEGVPICDLIVEKIKQRCSYQEQIKVN